MLRLTPAHWLRMPSLMGFADGVLAGGVWADAAGARPAARRIVSIVRMIRVISYRRESVTALRSAADRLRIGPRRAGRFRGCATDAWRDRDRRPGSRRRRRAPSARRDRAR